MGRGKGGGARGRIPRKCPADASRGRAPGSRVAEGRALRRHASAPANSHVSWQQRAFFRHSHRKCKGVGFGTRAHASRARRRSGIG